MRTDVFYMHFHTQYAVPCQFLASSFVFRHRCSAAWYSGKSATRYYVQKSTKYTFAVIENSSPSRLFCNIAIPDGKFSTFSVPFEGRKYIGIMMQLMEKINQKFVTGDFHSFTCSHSMCRLFKTEKNSIRRRKKRLIWVGDQLGNFVVLNLR